MLNISQQIEALKTRIADQQAEIENIQKEMDNFEVTITDEEYADVLDELYGDVEVAGYTFNTNRVLQELDPIAFRCGKSDYESGLDVEDDTDYQDLEDQLESMKYELSDLNDELSDLNSCQLI